MVQRQDAGGGRRGVLGLVVDRRPQMEAEEEERPQNVAACGSCNRAAAQLPQNARLASRLP